MQKALNTFNALVRAAARAVFLGIVAYWLWRGVTLPPQAEAEGFLRFTEISSGMIPELVVAGLALRAASSTGLRQGAWRLSNAAAKRIRGDVRGAGEGATGQSGRPSRPHDTP